MTNLGCSKEVMIRVLIVGRQQINDRIKYIVSMVYVGKDEAIVHLGQGHFIMIYIGEFERRFYLADKTVDSTFLFSRFYCLHIYV